MNDPSTEKSDSGLKEDLKNALEVAENRMLSALTSYHVWKWLNQSINIHNKDEDFANRNVSIINKYLTFLRHSFVSEYRSFVVSLSAFFDAAKYEDRFSISKLLNIIHGLMAETDFDQLKAAIGTIKRNHGVTITYINELRNADVVHQEIVPKKRTLNFNRIEGLFIAVQDVLNLISNFLGNSISAWSHIPDEVDRDMTSLFNNLERGENERLKEIENKYNLAKGTRPD